MDARDAVLQANVAFYRAFESLDLGQMERVWLQAPSIKCIHPGWGQLIGWGPVMDSWQRIFANTESMRFTLTQVHAEVVRDLAWVVLRENIESRTREGTVSTQVQTTNIFQCDAGRWLLVHHHGSPIYPPFVDAEPESMH